MRGGSKSSGTLVRYSSGGMNTGTSERGCSTHGGGGGGEKGGAGNKLRTETHNLQDVYIYIAVVNVRARTADLE
jgi:hypothetical protein